MIQQYYGGIAAKSAIVHQKVEFPTAPQIKEKTIYDNVPLPAMVMMWHSPAMFEEGDATADVLSNVLSGRADALLTKKLVYEQSLVQGVETFQYSRGRGSLFIVYIDALETTDLDQVSTIVTETLDGLAKGTTVIEEDTLRAIRNNLEMSFLWGLEDIQEKAEALQRYHHYLGQTDYVQKDLERYQAVTAEGLQSLTAQYFTTAKMSKLIVLPDPNQGDEDSTEGSIEDSSEGEGQ